MVNKSLIIMGEWTTYNVKDMKDAVNLILEQYKMYNTSMAEILACVQLVGFSIEDVAYIYGECLHISDRDVTVRIRSEIKSDVVANFISNEEILRL